MKERFYIEEQEPETGSTYYPVIKDKEQDNKIVCEDIYDTLKLLNKLTNVSEMYNFNSEQLIQLKEMIQGKLESAYFKLTTKELDLKNAENNLWLKTDFKEVGCTNDKMRTAYVSDATADLRFEITQLKYELKQQENLLIIVNDLIKLRLQEVKQG